MSYWSVVVPTIRPKNFLSFLDSWQELFEYKRVYLIVVEDADKKSAEISARLAGSRLEHAHICRKDVPSYIPNTTDMIRSAGILLAKDASRFTLSLDDDVSPHINCDRPDYNPFNFYEEVFYKGAVVSPYFSIGHFTSGDYQMRGFPHKYRKKKEVAVQYGGWHVNLDLDAFDQFHANQQQHNEYRFTNYMSPVPQGVPTTCCAMNMAWYNDYSCLMWQLPLLDGLYNRMGDIWSGLFIKKVLDLHDTAMYINGHASVNHIRASDPLVNIRRELPAFEINEGLWESLAGVDKANCDIRYTYIDVTDAAAAYFHKFNKAYANHFLKCRDKWMKNFNV